MEKFDVYIWTETVCGYADHSATVSASTYEDACSQAMTQTGLESAHRLQVFQIVDFRPEDEATYFDNVSGNGTGGYSAEKKWNW